MHKKIWAVFAAAAFFLVGCSSSSPKAETKTASQPRSTTAVSSVSPSLESGDRVKVVQVLDGNTIEVHRSGSSTNTVVRLLNVDTPRADESHLAVQCLSQEASDFLASLLPEGTEVTLEHDQQELDQYEQELAGIFLKDGSLVNETIARKGYGMAVQSGDNTRFYQQVLDAQGQAQLTQAGLHDPKIACTLPAQLHKGQMDLATNPVAAVPQVEALLQELDPALYAEKEEYGYFSALLALPNNAKAQQSLSQSLETAKKSLPAPSPAPSASVSATAAPVASPLPSEQTTPVVPPASSELTLQPIPNPTV